MQCRRGVTLPHPTIVDLVGPKVIYLSLRVSIHQIPVLIAKWRQLLTRKKNSDLWVATLAPVITYPRSGEGWGSSGRAVQTVRQGWIKSTLDPRGAMLERYPPSFIHSDVRRRALGFAEALAT